MDDLYSYISPIQRIAKDVQYRIEEREGEILMKAVHNVGFDVDKHELMKALAYDREQYEKGYADAMKNAVPLDKLCEWLGKVAIMRCEECGQKRCDGKICSSSNHWKKEITKWRDGLDGSESMV